MVEKAGWTDFGLKSFACRTFAISKTSKLVIKYNLASFRNRVGVQSFFGRPITRLLLDAVFVSWNSRPCLRLLLVQDGDGGVVDRIESAELKMEDFAVDGVVGDVAPCDGIASAALEGLTAKELIIEDSIVVHCTGAAIPA
jgi:hypothetical protein